MLVLEHRLVQQRSSAGLAAGWHAHLDALEASFSGGNIAWDERFNELLEPYRDKVHVLE